MRTKRRCDPFGAIPRGSSHHGIAHADKLPPFPTSLALVSFSLPLRGERGDFCKHAQKNYPAFVSQPTACSYFSARRRSAPPRTVRLLLSLSCLLSSSFTHYESCPHMHALRSSRLHAHTRTCVLFIFSFRWISYCRCRVCYYFQRASLHFQHVCTSHTVCIDFFFCLREDDPREHPPV